jgi:coenzyme F420-reducing hydrogenase alpha subunit
LRRLIYCGEWIESHALHIYLLHAPDFLGYESGLHMAQDRPDLLQRGLQLKKAGNRLMEVVGGRAVHPVNVRVGGFYRAPDRRDLDGVRAGLDQARQLALETVVWVAGFSFPDFDHDYQFVSLRHPTDYPITAGRVVSNRGLDIGVREYDQHFTELHVPHSTAPHSLLHGDGTYLVGPMARYSLNSGQLPATVMAAASAAGLGATCTNPFRSIIVRAIETLYACEEAIRLIDAYEPPEPGWVEVTPRDARSRPRPSSRPRRRTSASSNPTCARSSKTGWTCRTTASPGNASRPCAATTRASRARPTFSTCGSSARDPGRPEPVRGAGARDRHRQRVPR